MSEVEQLDAEPDRRLYRGVVVRIMAAGPVVMLALLLPRVEPFDWGAVASSVSLFALLVVLSMLGVVQPDVARKPIFLVAAILVANGAAGMAMVASQDLANTISLALVAAMTFQMSLRRQRRYTVLSWVVGSTTFVLAHRALGASDLHLFTRGVIFAGLTAVLLATFDHLVRRADASRRDAATLAMLAGTVASARELAEGVERASALIQELTGATTVRLTVEGGASGSSLEEVGADASLVPLGVSSAGPANLMLTDVSRPTYLKAISDLLSQLCERDRVLGDLLRHSRTDPVTGVANRRVLDEVIAAAKADTPRTLVMLDLDRFKDFNDRYGHLAGDELLGRFARTLEEHVRPGDHVSRYGGEEFCLLLQADLEGATRVVDRVRHAWAGQDEAVTFSAGIAREVGAESEASTSALSRADRALYQAKAAGRNCTVVDPEE